MPTILHSIGSFTFIDMRPVPPTPKRRLLVESRPGVDGVALWWDGPRGEIWRPRTVTDQNSHTNAQVLKELYEAAVAQGIVSVVYANRVFSNFAVIQDVQVEIEDQVFGVGGFTAFPRALVRANWELVVL